MSLHIKGYACKCTRVLFGGKQTYVSTDAGSAVTLNECEPYYIQTNKDAKEHRLRPYHVEYTSSRPITEVKQRRARLVLGWVTAWEYRVS